MYNTPSAGSGGATPPSGAGGDLPMIDEVPSTSYERISARYERERGGQARATAVGVARRW